MLELLFAFHLSSTRKKPMAAQKAFLFACNHDEHFT
jgi:hypothetical protein